MLDNMNNYRVEERNGKFSVQVETISYHYNLWSAFFWMKPKEAKEWRYCKKYGSPFGSYDKLTDLLEDFDTLEAAKNKIKEFKENREAKYHYL